MNQTFKLDEIGAGSPLDVRLLSQEELLDLTGGIGPVAAGLLLAGGGVTAFLLGAAVGVAIYYFTR